MRISEAHAKMMMRPLQVEAEDAIVGNDRDDDNSEQDSDEDEDEDEE